VSAANRTLIAAAAAEPFAAKVSSSSPIAESERRDQINLITNIKFNNIVLAIFQVIKIKL
jgi:hypothetical protein